jgi:hypothetical protein
LLRSEEFCLQVDAHSDFTKGWDVALIQQWHATGNEFSVLSTYPPDTSQLRDFQDGQARHHEIPMLCEVTITREGNVRNNRATPARNLGVPKLSTGWAAGLSFSKCHAERLVRYDPFLPYVYDGEEFSRAARMWTAGYDFYTPTRSIVFHDYSQPGTVVNFPVDTAKRDQAHARLFRLLQMPYPPVSTQSHFYRWCILLLTDWWCFLCRL